MTLPAHDHLLDQRLSKVDRLVLFVMALDKNLEAGELLRRELDFWLGEQSPGSSAAVLPVRVAPAVHRLLILAVIAEQISIV